MEESARLAQLRTDYNAAFERLRREVRALRLAEKRVDESLRTYRAKRDQLAEAMLAHPPHDLSSTGLQTCSRWAADSSARARETA